MYHAAPSRIDSSKVPTTAAASVTGLNFAYVVPPFARVYVFTPVTFRMPTNGPGAVVTVPPMKPCWSIMLASASPAIAKKPVTEVHRGVLHQVVADREGELPELCDEDSLPEGQAGHRARKVYADIGAGQERASVIGDAELVALHRPVLALLHDRPHGRRDAQDRRRVLGLNQVAATVILLFDQRFVRLHDQRVRVVATEHGLHLLRKRLLLLVIQARHVPSAHIALVGHALNHLTGGFRGDLFGLR